ncbi:hypothetical protein LWI29_020052 [Acer saccharum]|uniref:CCHC-type domain-containing protein n=1 Tax=Acer saccharum TaxID=4024 RepID=A0AA39SFA6_ACESA|nr:hypothetical protein LWI29_020052 [Acer saccharum]
MFLYKPVIISLRRFFSCKLSLHQFGIRAVFVRDINMPPKRRVPNRIPVEEANERDRVTQLEQQMAQITEQLATLIANQNPFHALNPNAGDIEDESNEESESQVEVPHQRRQVPERDDSRWWESEFKNVPANARVALVATRLRGHAAAWWQQIKLTRTRMGKSKITDWEKVVRLRTVDDYTTEFYQLIVRNDIQETQDQLVSRYCGGLRAQIMEVVNLFDPITVSEAHQRALQIEKSVSWRGVGGLLSYGNGGATGRLEGGSSSSISRTAAVGGSSSTPNTFSAPNQQPRATGGFKCFNCGEAGHRQSECKKLGKRVLFADTEEEEEVAVVGDEAQFDDDGLVNEDWVEGDVGPLLMARPVDITNSEIVKTNAISAAAQFTPPSVEEQFWNKRDASIAIGLAKMNFDAKKKTDAELQDFDAKKQKTDAELQDLDAKKKTDAEL